VQVRVDPVLQQLPAVFSQETIFLIVWDFSATMLLRDAIGDVDDGAADARVCLELWCSRHRASACVESVVACGVPVAAVRAIASGCSARWRRR
jgi:hypothetical protein